MNSLLDFKELATSENWEILATEHFPVTAGDSEVNATNELLNLRVKGARVILLSCLAVHVPQVLKQAEELDMIKDWVWILTDGAIAKVGWMFTHFSNTEYRRGHWTTYVYHIHYQNVSFPWSFSLLCSEHFIGKGCNNWKRCCIVAF